MHPAHRCAHALRRAGARSDGRIMVFAGIGILMALTVSPETLATAAPAASVVVARVDATQVPSGSSEVATLLARLNEARRSRGLATLVLDARLCAVALRHDLDMARRRYFSHVSPEGTSPFQRMARANLRFDYAAENIALDRDADAIHRDFLASTDHRENMLGRHYARVGIAAVRDTDGELVVEDFSD